MWRYKLIKRKLIRTLTTTIPLCYRKKSSEKLLENNTFSENLYGVRHTQVLLLFGLMVLAYGTRVILSVGIVAMTDPTASSNLDIPVSKI